MIKVHSKITLSACANGVVGERLSGLCGRRQEAREDQATRQHDHLFVIQPEGASDAMDLGLHAIKRAGSRRPA